jgi:hypothetical protein
MLSDDNTTTSPNSAPTVASIEPRAGGRTSNILDDLPVRNGTVTVGISRIHYTARNQDHR